MPTLRLRHGSMVCASHGRMRSAARSPTAGQSNSRLNNGRYEALIEGEWRPVPDDHILNRADNPTGRAVACWTPQAGVICFVRAPDS